MPFANRQTVQTLLLEFVRIATAFLAACGHGQRQQTRPTCPRSCPTQAHGHHAQHPAPQPRHHHGQTVTEGDGHGQRPSRRAERRAADTDGRRRNTPAPSPAASRSTQRSRRQSPSRPARSHPAPPACRPCCTPSRLTESGAGKERGREGKRKEQPRHTLKTAAKVIIPNPGPPCAPPAVTGHLEPPRFCFRTPSTATTPPPFQFCFWRENRTGPQNNPEYTRESGTASTAPPTIDRGSLYISSVPAYLKYASSTLISTRTPSLRSNQLSTLPLCKLDR